MGDELTIVDNNVMPINQMLYIHDIWHREGCKILHHGNKFLPPHGLYSADTPSGIPTVYSSKKP